MPAIQNISLSNQKLPSIFLKPSEVYISKRPTAVTTVLGSCIAITMFNRESHIAAICHAVMPICHQILKCDLSCKERYKYVNCVIPMMCSVYRRNNVLLKDIEVKLFGGSEMFGIRRLNPATRPSIGAVNVETARQLLEEEGLRIKVSHVGGFYGRKIIFFTHTGDVYLKRIRDKALIRT